MEHRDTGSVTGPQDAPAFDYDKLAGILAGRQAQNEESVLRGYFRSMGITGEEAALAIGAFKAQKAAQTPDPSLLAEKAAQAKAAAERALLENHALLMADELGVALAVVPYLLKMAELAGVVSDEGQVDDTALRAALEKVLADLPQLREKRQEKVGAGFRVGLTPESGAAGEPTGRMMSMKDVIAAKLASEMGR